MSEQFNAINLEVVEEARSIMNDKFPLMVEYYLEDAQKYMNIIQEGLAENDAVKITSPAHTIKSSSKQLGAMDLASHAEKIEEISRNIMEGSGGDIEAIKEIYQQMQEAFKAAESELKRLVS